jgi:hypothetical protein
MVQLLTRWHQHVYSHWSHLCYVLALILFLLKFNHVERIVQGSSSLIRYYPLLKLVLEGHCIAQLVYCMSRGIPMGFGQVFVWVWAWIPVPVSFKMSPGSSKMDKY